MDLLNLREPVSAWSHGAWMLLSLPATVMLWRKCGGDPAKRLSLLIFGLSLAFCYGASALYHGARTSAGWITVFERVDYIGIYILIAGSYTPLACNLLRGRWRRWTLTLAWMTTAVAAVLLAAHGLFPPLISTTIYVVMGWGCVACYTEIARVISHRAMGPIVLGGVFYTVGAILNLLHWPVLWPGVFRAHELFHLFVMAGSLTHFWFMLRVVVPFSPRPALDLVSTTSPEPRRSSYAATMATGQFGT